MNRESHKYQPRVPNGTEGSATASFQAKQKDVYTQSEAQNGDVFSDSGSQQRRTFPADYAGETRRGGYTSIIQMHRAAEDYGNCQVILFLFFFAVRDAIYTQSFLITLQKNNVLAGKALHGQIFYRTFFI